MRRQVGTLGPCLEVRGDCSEWEVEVDGASVRAVAYASLCGPLRPGDAVLLNTTAVDLGLGTGGVHFVIGSANAPPEDLVDSLPDRAAGHCMKLRYTPHQVRVLAAEEEASPHHEALLASPGLDGMPVVAAELLSQAATAVLAARAVDPSLRIVLLHLDSAALPVAFSRLLSRLRQEGSLAAIVSAGQSFGGDFEAVNVYSGLQVARVAAQADLVVATQGPGNAGTGTPFGFGGLALVEALHAADHLGGRPVLALRLSDGDPRPRHRGVSAHTRTLLRCLRCPVALPAPPEALPLLERELPGLAWHVVDPGAPPPWTGLVTTMGRTPEQDPLFFRAAAAAGVYAAERATGKPLPVPTLR